jgi:hypothetical protein
MGTAEVGAEPFFESCRCCLQRSASGSIGVKRGGPHGGDHPRGAGEGGRVESGRWKACCIGRGRTTDQSASVRVVSMLLAALALPEVLE